jgi:hypothetical protein
MSRYDIDDKTVMSQGGLQLLDLIHKQISYHYFLRCMYHLKLTPYDLLILKVWLDNDGDVLRTINSLREQDEIEMSTNGMRDFFQKMLVKVFYRINMTPKLDEQGNVTEPLMFVNYEVYNIEESPFKVVVTSLNREAYWSDHVLPKERKKLETVHVFYQDDYGNWKISTRKFAKQYRESYKKMKEIMDGGL